MADRQDNRSSDEIRRDIEGTRSDLHRTVDALEERLSVGQLVDEVWGRMGGTRAAASNVGDAIRDHPVPLALMGLGVAWLAVDKATGTTGSHTGDGPGTYDPAEGRVGPYRGDAVHSSGSSTTGGAGEKARQATDQAKGKASEAATKAKDKASAAADTAKRKASDARDSMRSSGDGRTTGDGGGDMREWAGEATGRAREATGRARDATERAREGMARGTGRARRGFRSAMEEQPLALGAITFGLGLASGLAAPSSRWEDRAMGGAADTVKDEAGSFARDAAEDAKHIAKETADAAREEADRQGAQMKESGKSIAHEAKETAKERSHDREMDPESMKKRATRSSKRAEERAKD